MNNGSRKVQRVYDPDEEIEAYDLQGRIERLPMPTLTDAWLRTEPNTDASRELLHRILQEA